MRFAWYSAVHEIVHSLPNHIRRLHNRCATSWCLKLTTSIGPLKIILAKTLGTRCTSFGGLPNNLDNIICRKPLFCAFNLCGAEWSLYCCSLSHVSDTSNTAKPIVYSLAEAVSLNQLIRAEHLTMSPHCDQNTKLIFRQTSVQVSTAVCMCSEITRTLK